MKSREEPIEGQVSRHCPYCDDEVDTSGPVFCRPCGVVLRYCSKCQVAVAREAEVCPECGGELEWK